MQSIRHTYRALTASLLLTFAMGMLGPAGISAAGLFCEMGPETMTATAHDCCEDHATQNGEGHMPSHAGMSDSIPCDMDVYCLSFVDKAVDEAPAVQQGSQKVPAAVISGDIRFGTVSDRTPAFLQQESPSRIHGPPLFLLNASFLN